MDFLPYVIMKFFQKTDFEIVLHSKNVLYLKDTLFFQRNSCFQDNCCMTFDLFRSQITPHFRVPTKNFFKL